jgi:prepilin-type N-terminal cleavage/methylation domain-containing protein
MSIEPPHGEPIPQCASCHSWHFPESPCPGEPTAEDIERALARGYTLIELLIALAVLALAGMLLHTLATIAYRIGVLGG